MAEGGFESGLDGGHAGGLSQRSQHGDRCAEVREACRGAIHAAELSRHPLGDKFNEEASRLLEKIRAQIRAHNDAKRRVYTYVESQQMGPSVLAEDSKSLGCWYRRERYGATRYGWQVDPDSDEDVCLGRELT